jgi:hypothetical protein
MNGNTDDLNEGDGFDVDALDFGEVEYEDEPRPRPPSPPRSCWSAYGTSTPTRSATSSR